MSEIIKRRVDSNAWEVMDCIYDEMGLAATKDGNSKQYAKLLKSGYESGKCIVVRFPNPNGKEFVIDILQGSDDVIEKVGEVVKELNTVTAENATLKGTIAAFVDGLDSNIDPERCGLTQKEWNRIVERGREAIKDE